MIERMPGITKEIAIHDTRDTLLITQWRIYYFNSLGALQVVWVTSSPNSIVKGRPMDLKCFFSGWPLPREIYWYKDGELITNGNEGIYHSADKKWKNGKETLRGILHLPPGREDLEGYYKCSATNSIPGWSSSDSYEIEMIYECK